MSLEVTKFLMFFPILLLSVAIHEFAHCWTNDRLGDDTPRSQGRVTLNPLAHLDPVGTIMMVVSSLSGFGFGWGKPSPFNPMNFRHPARDRMLGAIAGPLSNVLQMLAWASLGSLLYSLLPGDVLAVPLKLCEIGVSINAALAVFNMLPVYPLDGHHLLSYLAPRSWRPVIDNPAWGMVFLAIVLIPQLRDAVFSAVLQPVLVGLSNAVFFLVG